jgi:hypothetical protein
LLNQKTNLDIFKGIKKGVLKKLADANIVSVADYLSTKKFVLVDELELTSDQVDSISSAVNEFISKNDEPELTEEAPAEDIVEAIVEEVEKESSAKEEAPSEEVVVEEAPSEEEVVEEAPAEEEVVEETPAEEEVEEEK